MKKYEVEVTHVVVAENEDDAVAKLRAWLDKQTITLWDGPRSYHTYDGCVREAEEK